jgi:TRAP-type mannitol/chloroaromatic compound transport system substrate-binding protein
MDRRKFVANSTVAGAASLVAGSAFAQSPEVRWRCASSYPKSLDTVFNAPQIVADYVAKATGGKFQITLHAAGELVPAFGVLDAVSNANVECGHTASFFYWGKDPSLVFDYTVPFGMNARQYLAWYQYGEGRALIQESMRTHGIVSFACGNFGAQMGGWFRKEIKSLADLKGMKMRIGGFSGAVFAKVGGVPQSIPGGEIYPALERGVIDSAEWVGPYDDEKLGLAKIAKYYYYPGWQEGSGQISFYVNQQKHDALPPEYKALLEMACQAATLLTLSKYDHANPAAIRRLVGGGAQLRAFPKEVLAGLYKATKEVLEEQSAKSDKFKRLYDSYRNYQASITPWFTLGEMSYDRLIEESLRSK